MKKVINKYNIFLKYIIVSILSFVIDISIFTLFNTGIKLSIVISTITARIISSFFNYMMNKEKVFKSKENIKESVIKYYLLVVIQMFASAFLVNTIHGFININASIIKMPVELLLFIISYLVQKLIIFKIK